LARLRSTCFALKRLHISQFRPFREGERYENVLPKLASTTWSRRPGVHGRRRWSVAVLAPRGVAGLALIKTPAGSAVLVANTGDSLQAFTLLRRR